jgi:hypothetical protein
LVCHIEGFTLPRVLRKIFEHKRDKATEDRRRSHNEKLLTIYDAGDQIKEVEVGGACGTYGRRKMHTGFWWV